MQTDDSNKIRLMIVEDEYLIAASIKIAAEKAGLKVVGIAPQMDLALKLCGETKPHFSTMDLNLAGPETGIETATALARQFGVPSLFVSAYSDDREKALAVRPPSLGWLDKPFVMRDIQQELEKCVEKLALRRAD